MSDPCWLGVAGLAKAYRTGSLRPTDLTEALIARIDRLEPALHAFIALDREALRADARAADAVFAHNGDPAPLTGIPIGIKDVIDVAGFTTTCHSAILEHAPPATLDAAVVTHLRRAGATIAGKLATHEFAIGGPAFDLPFPPARNPWNVAHHPGGSSSGAGTAVAGGLLPGAIGTDTAGSVRNPASACGIVGLKPTRGVVPTKGVFPLAPSLDHVGPLARCVDDVALLFAAMTAQKIRSGMPGKIEDVRIGVVRHFHERDMPCDDAVAAAFEAAVSVLARLGARIVPIDLAPLNDFADVTRAVMQAEGFAVHRAWMRARPGDYCAITRRTLLPGAFLSADALATALRLRAALFANVEDTFAGVDILLTASSMTPACRIDDPAEIARTYMRNARAPFNLTGHPALAMMAGLSPDGLPLSIQFAARRHQEALLLNVAAAYEQAMGGPRRPPI
ncbi:amidase [Sphingomonas immobilis]|uniref:Amidase n=1 Tax=Sphingomonas immobilis TaxID=3063997 RepID=A0ABT9A0N0_9SPHN|nr:amidase [Sphingomonas sp. CA1-15]MDO7843390.1 amidase [Sphingomonas sp. CA1-15]